VTVFADLEQRLHTALDELVPGCEVRRKLGRACVKVLRAVASLKKHLTSAASNQVLLLRSWEEPGSQAFNQLCRGWGYADDSTSSCEDEEEEEEEEGQQAMSLQQRQQQAEGSSCAPAQPPPAASASAAAAGAAAAQQSWGRSSRRRVVAAKRQQQQPRGAGVAAPGCAQSQEDPIPWLGPGGCVVFIWGNARRREHT
jgi:hypothetical protein